LQRKGSFDEKKDDQGHILAMFSKEMNMKKKQKEELHHLKSKDISENLFKQSGQVINSMKKSLPIAEYENFLGDLKDIIHWNTDYMLSKINAFYMCHVARNLKISKE
jgi:hypothetical protein